MPTLRKLASNSLVFPSIFLTLLLILLPSCDGRVFSFEMHHRFSDPVKQWSEAAGKLSPVAATNLPEKGSFEYYAELANRDRLLRGRKLVESTDTLAFSDGNSTFQITSLGYLHYTTVQLGTPGMKFMVALDTGSDLFWVPCEGTAYAPNFEVSKYDPKGSSTSKKVRCNNRLCMQRNKCLGAFNTCPYRVSYVSDQTSTSGILVEDVLHLTTEDSHHEYVEAYITFGCGQVQSGSFLDIAAPNGLFGLGMEKISVPSILSREGFTADSFSMCFGHDGVGRINFGDKGSPDQEETPFNYNPSHPTYNISVTQIRVGTDIMDIDFTALFDSGTSFTYLDDPTYTRISESFNSQARDKRRPPDSRIPFEYCYDMSPDANASWISGVSLTMKGGSQFEVYNPIIVISTQSELVYCLAVVKSLELNIIGQRKRFWAGRSLTAMTLRIIILTCLLNHAPTMCLLLLLMDYATILFQNQRKRPARLQLLLCFTIVILLFRLAFYSPSSSSSYHNCDMTILFQSVAEFCRVHKNVEF